MKRYSWDICDSSFDSRDKYVSNVHISSAREEKRPHKCEKKDILTWKCQATKMQYLWRSFFKKTGVYEKKKPYTCLICNGSFTLKDSSSKGLSMFNSQQIIFKKTTYKTSS
jgi:hypothetical protein